MGGLGNRKILTPKSSKISRRHSQILKESLLLQEPLSPDIITSKIASNFRSKPPKLPETKPDQVRKNQKASGPSSLKQKNENSNENFILSNQHDGQGEISKFLATESPTATEIKPTKRQTVTKIEGSPITTTKSFVEKFCNSNSSFERGPANSSQNDLDKINFYKQKCEEYKRQFDELARNKLSAPEDLLIEFKRYSQSRDAAAENSIQALKGENIRLGQLLQEVQAENEQYEKQLSELKDKNSFLEKITSIYSSLSGLEIASKSDTVNEFECKFKGKSLTLPFNLCYSTSTSHYQYLPSLDNFAELQKLPLFLTNEILITPDQMHLFFWRIMDSINKLG